jgi:hypothetical protein
MNLTSTINLLKLISIFFIAITLLTIYELSTNGMMIAGEYRIYYLTDFFEFIRDLF